MNVSAILFDFDHTLGYDNGLEEAVLRELAQRYCKNVPDDAAIHAVLHRFRTDHATLSSAIGTGLQAWGYHAADLDEVVAGYKARVLELAPSWVLPMPHAREAVEELFARGMPIGILSNGWTQLQQLKADLFGFPGPTLVSEEIGAWKPDAASFEIAAARFAMDPPTTLYVGDTPDVDVVGAKAAGMLAAWANLGGAAYPVDVISPDISVTSLAQLVDFVPRP